MWASGIKLRCLHLCAKPLPTELSPHPNPHPRSSPSGLPNENITLSLSFLPYLKVSGRDLLLYRFPPSFWFCHCLRNPLSSVTLSCPGSWGCSACITAQERLSHWATRPPGCLPLGPDKPMGGGFTVSREGMAKRIGLRQQALTGDTSHTVAGLEPGTSLEAERG